jgi:glycosyltransferase XagB
LKMIIVFYPYQLVLAVASFRAAYRYLRRHHGWEKTTHSNLHRRAAVPRLWENV